MQQSVIFPLALSKRLVISGQRKGKQMTKSISDAQAAFLQKTLNLPYQGDPSPRGLLTRGFIAYEWGLNPSFGYNVTPDGYRALEQWEVERS
jgi:hypothetical protein